jgi:hypothetical protein
LIRLTCHVIQRSCGTQLLPASAAWHPKYKQSAYPAMCVRRLHRDFIAKCPQI